MATSRFVMLASFSVLLMSAVIVACSPAPIAPRPTEEGDTSALETQIAESILATLTASAPTSQPAQPTEQLAPAPTPTLASSIDTPTPTLAPPTPTPVPATATPTPIPSPTMRSNTPPGSVLNVGETWAQDGVVVTLTEVEYGSTFNYPGQTLVHFRLLNETPDQVLFTLDCVEWHVSDNLGNRYRCDEIGTRGGSGYERLDLQVDSQDTQVFVVRVDGIPYDSAITSMSLLADTISRITNAAWTWAVHH
jgi:hypothetical protein